MRTKKTYLGPKLRQLRKDAGQTQMEMAQALGLSTSYVNLLENNQRSLSVQVLMRVSEVYGVEWRDLVQDDTPNKLADLRNVLQDPVFEGSRPDLQELRASLDHCPQLAESVLGLHKAYRALMERALTARTVDGAGPRQVFTASPEAAVHDLFRRNRNHFPALESAAESFFDGGRAEADEIYAYLKNRLTTGLGIEVETVAAADLPDTLRFYDQAGSKVLLSEVLDFPNRIFQLTHMLALLEYGEAIDALIESAGVTDLRQQARCRVELANYLAAAVLMPYAAFLAEARASKYDLDHLAARFGVSFEQVCHRVTTLQREGAQGVPFFFLRVDKAGNVTKRFNATSFHLADHGGSCPRWDLHLSFRTPGRIMPQFVELPDGQRYFTINRTVDRPNSNYQAQDNRLAVALGCSIEHAGSLIYAEPFQLGAPDLFTPIGINCRLCPRQACAQRAHQPLHLDLPIDENRRGQTRFES
ncbi:MAG: short-chain fatty acyl-CoA regulator family protein [Pseudomonadota bacterium]